MKQLFAFIPAFFAVCLLGGCISSTRPMPAVLAPLKPDTALQEITAWPVVPVVRLPNGEPYDLHGTFGDAAPVVRAYLHDCMADYEACQKSLMQDKKHTDPNRFEAQFHLLHAKLMKTVLTPALTPMNKASLDGLMLMHNVCDIVNSRFFRLAKPHASIKELQDAVDDANSLQEQLKSLPGMNVPAIMQRAMDDGDVLGAEWSKCFDGTTPLSSVPDEWTIAVEGTEQPVPCPYGYLFPTGPEALNPTKGKLLTLSVQTTVPHDGKTPVYLIGQGLPAGSTVTLDGVPLAIDAGVSSVRLTIPPQIATDEPQTLAISWHCNLHEHKRIFRQLWFVMKR